MGGFKSDVKKDGKGAGVEESFEEWVGGEGVPWQDE